MKITVTVKPNSKRPGVERIDETHLVVRVSAPAHEGKANSAVVKALAKFLDIAPSRINIARGMRARTKTIDID